MAAATIEKHVRKAVRILREGDDDAKIAAARNLANLADLGENEDHYSNNKVRTAKAGGIPPLVELLRDGSATAQACAAQALGNLALKEMGSSFNFRVLIAEAGGIPPLVELLRHGRANRKEKSASALGSLAWANHDIAVLIAEAGGIEPLVALLRDGSASGKEMSVRALGGLAGNYLASAALIGEAGGIEPLVALLRDWSNGTDTKWQAVRRVWQAADTLHRLAANNDANALAIAAAVGFDALLQLARRGRVTVDNKAVVQFAGIPAKRKAALVAGQLLEAAAPRTRFTKYIKADIASYL
jgi:vacuolar protein 8